MAEYFEELYDYSEPLRLPQPKQAPARSVAEPRPVDPYSEIAPETPAAGGKREIPTWTGSDVLVSEELRIIGPNGEKVDYMTYRGAFERDLREFAGSDEEFHQAVENEDDDAVDELLQARFFNRPVTREAGRLLRRPRSRAGVRVQCAGQAAGTEQVAGRQRRSRRARCPLRPPLQ